VTALYGWALQRAGRGVQSERVLRGLVAASDDKHEAAVGLAAALLGDGSGRR
jgi:hypothetical protein